MSGIHELSDDELIHRCEAAVKRDHRTTEALLRLIDEIDQRRLWAELAYSSTFDLCRRRFNMSEGVAYKRIGVARLARNFPVVFSMIGRGELHLSGALKLKTLLTKDNHARILGRAAHRSVREIDELVAELQPKPDVPSRIRKLPRRKGATLTEAASRRVAPGVGRALRPPPAIPLASSVGTGDLVQSLVIDESPEARERARQMTGSLLSAEHATPRVRRSPDPKPLSPQRYKLEVTIDEDTHITLTQLQNLLAHQIPNGDPALIVQRALAALLKQTLKRKVGLTDNPRTEPGDVEPGPSVSAARRARKRGIPVAIRRAVWERDGGRCAFVGRDGRRCDETRRLEFAHGKAFALGGEHSVDNIELRCDGHNQYEAERDFGKEFMRRKRTSGIRERVASYERATAEARRSAREPRACGDTGAPLGGTRGPPRNEARR